MGRRKRKAKAKVRRKARASRRKPAAKKEPERTCYINPPARPLRHRHPLCGGTWRMSYYAGNDLVCDNCDARADSSLENLDAIWGNGTT